MQKLACSFYFIFHPLIINLLNNFVKKISILRKKLSFKAYNLNINPYKMPKPYSKYSHFIKNYIYNLKFYYKFSLSRPCNMTMACLNFLNLFHDKMSQ